MIAVGLLGLYINVTKRLNDLEKDFNKSEKKHSRTRQRVRDLEEEARKKKDSVTIFHKWDEADGIRYPSQEV